MITAIVRSLRTKNEDILYLQQLCNKAIEPSYKKKAESKAWKNEQARLPRTKNKAYNIRSNFKY